MTEEQTHTKCYGCYNLDTPLLPDKLSENCKEASPKPVCDACGCTGQDKDGKTTKRMFGRGEGVVWNCKQQCCCCFGIFVFVYIVLFGIIQWIFFHFATINCGSLPDDYNFPGGGHGDNGTGPAINLMPRNALIVAREPSIYGDAFDVFNSTEEGEMVSAPVGTWFRTWGPWFYTYTYQDTLNSKATVYMRRSVVGMTGAIREVEAMRCDGKGDVLKVTEGTGVIGNAFREFFRTNTGAFFKMLVNGEEKGLVEETFHGQKSATFRTVGEKNKDVFGSLILRGVNKQGFNEWFLKNDRDQPVPFWMSMSVAVNYAYKIHNLGKSGSATPAFLAAFHGLLSSAKDAASEQSQDITNVATETHAAVPTVSDAQSVKV